MLFRSIESQYREYDEMYDLAHNALEERHKEAKGVSPMAKISSYIMININAMADGSVSSMAEMMMKGSNKGIIEITKHLNDMKDVDPCLLYTSPARPVWNGVILKEADDGTVFATWKRKAEDTATGRCTYTRRSPDQRRCRPT